MAEEPKYSPGLDPEARESQLCDLAIALAEKQLREGTASAQVITHYLKLASSREQLEQQMIQTKQEMIKAKTESIKAGERVEELYNEAMEAFKSYRGY